MENYNIIGIDLAKHKFYIAAINNERKLILSQSITREDFFSKFLLNMPKEQTFAFEACGGCHYVAQILKDQGHKVIILKPKDVKPYAKSRQKNDANDALAICKAALDPELMRVHMKSKYEQEVSYLHKSRQNLIQQRIQRTNSVMTSLMEFGYIVKCGKSVFADKCLEHAENALKNGYIPSAVHAQIVEDCKEIENLIKREKGLSKSIVQKNKESERATKLETIPGIGPINASILSTKAVESYSSAKDFAASLGLVPKQYTTGGDIVLGSITKQGDRYARTMLIQAGRSILMRSYKNNPPIDDDLYQFVERLKNNGKGFNVACVAVANKLARIAYACSIKNQEYSAKKAA